jgi:hypothetical protein
MTSYKLPPRNNEFFQTKLLLHGLLRSYVIDYSDHHKLVATYRPSFVCVKDACMHHVLTAAWLLRLVRASLCYLSFFTELYEYVFTSYLSFSAILPPWLMKHRWSLTLLVWYSILEKKGVSTNFGRAIHRPLV